MAAAATMFAACTQSDFVNEVPETEQAIGFETFVNKSTRAENSSADYSWSLSDHHLAFTVWGHKKVGATGVKVFEGKEVSYSSSKWAYEGALVYWDKGASQYDFYAVAPVKADFWTLNNNATPNVTDDDYITTETFTVKAHNAASYKGSSDENVTKSFKDVAYAEDLMIAAPATVGSAKFGSDVNLQFIHLLSRLNVNVTTSLDGIVIKSIKVGNMNSTGTFDEKRELLTGETLATGTYSRWDVTNDVISYAAGEKALTKNEGVIAIEALVMPQLAAVETVALDVVDFAGKNEPYLYVEYTLNGENYHRAYNLADTFNGTGSDALAFNEGWQYKLSLSIGATAITFTANVAKWADGTPAGTQDIN